jgi:hypothetical protein
LNPTPDLGSAGNQIGDSQFSIDPDFAQSKVGQLDVSGGRQQNVVRL